MYVYIRFLYIRCYLQFCWFIFGSVCDCLLHGGRPSRSFVVGISVTSVVLMPRMQGVLCAVIWCSFPVML
jgi:hypothetical protein